MRKAFQFLTDLAGLALCAGGLVGIVTAVVPWLGYERSSQIASEALKTGRSIRDIILQAGDLSAEQLDHILSAEQMTAPRPMRS